MGNANYHIIKRNTYAKDNAIIEIEGCCPECKGKNTKYKKIWRSNDTIWQNHYTCYDCGTEWAGNSYNESYDRIDGHFSPIRKKHYLVDFICELFSNH